MNNRSIIVEDNTPAPSSPSFRRQFQVLDTIVKLENATKCLQCGVVYHKSRKISFTNGICKFCVDGRGASRVLGISSLCADNSHFLMWDFDNCNLDGVRSDLRRIQLTYTLSDIHIFNSSPGDNWQAVCFDKFEAWRANEILKASKEVDADYYFIYDFRNRATLRLTPKGRPLIKYKLCLESNNAVRKQSCGGWIVYAKLFTKVLRRPLRSPDKLWYPYLEGFISRHVGEQHK